MRLNPFGPGWYRGILGHAYRYAGRYDEGAKLFDQITASEDFVDFLTLPAYQMID